ncbi:hypothetical protein JAO29_03705 [Edaphobacter sp. HDX4]|uniref:hypothetical protein n=1 Tax=Edaphobacter sp. HDX4 TaxID=2794064 RepID=UPI002FE526F0
MLLLILAATIPRTHAQTGEIENLFSDFEASAAAGKHRDVAEADPALQRIAQASSQRITEMLPVIIHETSSPQLSSRRLAAAVLYAITTRPDGQSLLSAETATFKALLVDPDIPIRRITMLAVYTLRPNASSPIVPVLKTYLEREDAVSTIGPAVATVLMQAAPNDEESTNTVVQYMRRQDQTSASRYVLLDAIVNVAKSHNREIGKEVVSYADDPSEQTSVRAIGTLQAMGQSVILDSQQSLSRIAADPKRAPSVRAAATKALTAIQ